MTNEEMENLPELLKKFICTLKKASYDDANKEFMCESQIEVIDFDKFPNEYARDKGWNGVPKSNDALYISKQKKWYFIEFKNGSIKYTQLYEKIYDSLIMLIDSGIVPDFNFVRENISYILVYNSDKYGRVQESAERDKSFSYFEKLAKEKRPLFGIDRFEKYLFDTTKTYTKTEFYRDFVVPMEKAEGIYKNCEELRGLSYR